jgi:hypothetical protein
MTCGPPLRCAATLLLASMVLVTPSRTAAGQDMTPDQVHRRLKDIGAFVPPPVPYGSMTVGALRVATKKFKWLTTKSLIPKPLIRPFNMIVLGDSIMWGQGLEDGQKFSTAVQQWVRAQLPGVGVRREVFAHSGAGIGPDGGDGSPPKPAELPTGVPSVTKQIELAKTRLGQVGVSPEQVDLVLMDGGINDVGVPNNLLNNNPNFTTPTSAAFIAARTQQVAVAPMCTLLHNVATAFPAATIVVTGYYPIVSEFTNADPMYSWVNVIGVLPLFLTAKVMFEKEWLLGLHDRWTQNCRAFDITVREGQQKVVDDLNRQVGCAGVVGLRPDDNNPDGLPAGHNTPPPASHPPGRIVFVTVPFGKQNSYGTNPQDTWLWTFGDQAFAPGVAESRRIDCGKDGRTGFDLTSCQEAEAGHPNIVGASKYGEGIIAALASFVPKWRTQFPPTSPAKVLVLRIDPTTPHLEVDKPVTVTVYATDRATGANVNGTVSVGNVSSPTGTPFQCTFCRMTFDPIKKRRVVECDRRPSQRPAT